MKKRNKTGFIILANIIIQIFIFVAILLEYKINPPVILALIFFLLFTTNIVLFIIYINNKIKSKKNISINSNIENKEINNNYYTKIEYYKDYLDELDKNNNSEEGVEPYIYEPEKKSKNGTYEYDIKYNGVNIVINFNIEDSKKHLLEDYKVLEKEGIENIIKNQFIFWLKGEEFKDRDTNKIYEGLKVYSINYHYSKIIDKYSPTGKENYFGQFEFEFESSNDYTNDMLEAVAMEVYVLNGKIVKVSGYDI